MSALLPHRFLFRFRFPVIRDDGLPRSQRALLDLSPDHRVCDPASLDGETAFAELRIAWNPDGLGFLVHVTGKRQPPVCHLEKPSESDGLQLWIDTRDTQTIHRASRFCHWFCVLPCGDGADGTEPAAVQLPVPRAREDAPLCDPDAILLSSELREDGYSLETWLTAEVLNGFDPETQPRIGFNYLVRDSELGTQSLAVRGDFPSGSDPSLWSTLECCAAAPAGSATGHG